jgi:hypothetical protein
MISACGDDSAGTPDAGGTADAPVVDGPGMQSFLLEVSPAQVVAREHFGGTGESPFVFTFHVPADLQGGGMPADLTSGSSDLSVIEMELPQGGGSTDEHAMVSVGLVNFDSPKLCMVGGTCATAGVDGSWKATVIGADGSMREVQLAVAMKDLINRNAAYAPVFGVFLPAPDALHAGDKLQFSYIGKMSGRATDWTDQPLLANFRYRSFTGGAAGAWTTLDDTQVQPLQIAPTGTAKYIRLTMPLDVQVGQPFTVVVVATDHYGNPQPITGSVQLSGAMTADIAFTNEWRKEIPNVTVATAGLFKIVPAFAGARSVYQYAMASTSAPPIVRMVGDVHSHSGDGGAQRKFIGAFLAGDHKGLFTRTHDALRYMHEVAGHDFGAVSEHSVRQDTYTPPAPVAADANFQAGGACAGAGAPIPALGNWWPVHQSIVADYAVQTPTFIAFPAFEWHAAHTQATDRSPLHRIVLFRDFDAQNALPILPGDVENIAPQCIVRFLSDVSYGPNRVLVVPHMMQANDLNIDWDLTYADTTVAPRTLTDTYYRIGEVFSARAIDQGRAYGKATLQVFEVGDNTTGRWHYRYGWRAKGAHIGLIGSADNHEQMPGVNDDVDLDGVNYHSNEPGGYAVVLATAKDRGAIFDAMSQRHTYATSGLRAWMDFSAGGAPMGSQTTSNAASVDADITLAAGMSIITVEVWASQVGGPPGYTLLHTDAPLAETYSQTVTFTNPGAGQEWLYYVRAFFKASGSPNDADEAVWSSPIWITWQ